MKKTFKLLFLFLAIIFTRYAYADEQVAVPKFNAPSAQNDDHTNNGKFFPEDIIQGNKDAKIIVIEYFGLTCPHCAYFHKEIYPKIKTQYIDTGKIAFVQREFIGTKQDMDAAVLARCGGDDKRLIFFDVLLAQQQNWAFNRNYIEILTNIAQMGGVSPEQYKKCMEDQALGTILMDNTKLISRTPGFVGTPVFIINNKLYNGKFSFEELSKVIDGLQSGESIQDEKL